MGGKGARMRSRLAPLIAVLLAAFSVIGCSDGSTEPETSEPAVPQPPSTTTTTVAATTSAKAPTTTGVGSEVTLTADIQFATGAPDLVEWSDPLLDIYAPGAGRDLPLVVILPPHAWDLWLDPTHEDPAPLQELLVSYPAARMAQRRVSTTVNNARNEGPGCQEEPEDTDQTS